MFGYVLWKSTNKTQVQGTRHCTIYFHTHPAGDCIGLCTYYAHRCLLYQLAQRWTHSVCAQPFTTTLISLGLIASVELLPCLLMILVGVLAWVLLPNSFSMFRHSTVKAMLLHFGSFGADVSSSILAERNNPSQLIIIILYASVLVFLTGVGPLQLNDETMKKSSLRKLK